MSVPMGFYRHAPLAIQMNSVLRCKLCGLLCGWDRLDGVHQVRLHADVPGEVSSPMRGCLVSAFS